MVLLEQSKEVGQGQILGAQGGRGGDGGVAGERGEGTEVREKQDGSRGRQAIALYGDMWIIQP